MAAVTANLAHPEASFQFYALLFLLELLGFSLFGCTFLTSLGVLVSLRSATARQAYQRLTIVFMVVWLPHTVAVLLSQKVQISLDTVLTGLNYIGFLGWTSLVLAVIDIVLLAIAARYFHRSLLVLA